jgi:hypothetical protein
MIFQWPSIEEMMPLIIAIILLVADIFILKIGLTITKAEDKTSFKWVAGSFGIQFALILFISTPMIIAGSTGAFSERPPIGLIIPTIIFSAFIDLHIVNVLHKIGMKRSLIIIILILAPITIAMWLIGENIGILLNF